MKPTDTRDDDSFFPLNVTAPKGLLAGVELPRVLRRLLLDFARRPRGYGPRLMNSLEDLAGTAVTR